MGAIAASPKQTATAVAESEEEAPDASGHPGQPDGCTEAADGIPGGEQCCDGAAAPVSLGQPSAGGLTPAGALPSGVKLVVSLRPNGSGRYRAFIGIGADGCDPLLRCAEVAGLAEVLHLLPGLLDEAEAVWRTRRRNPTVPPRPRGPAVAKAGKAEPRVPPAEAIRETKPAEPPATVAKTAPAGQLSLFG